MITVTAFKWVPPLAQGLVRDLRVRWALEEAGLPHAVRLIDVGDHKTAAHRALQPFGQIPVLEEDGLVLFETGAILMHIAARSEILLPGDEKARARTSSWVFAALNSIEPSIAELATIDLFRPGEAWTRERRPQVETDVRERLADLATWLGDRPWLEGDRFTAGDLMMTTVLRILRHTDLVDADPVLGPYKARCEARPAFVRALKAQLDTFAANEPDSKAA